MTSTTAAKLDHGLASLALDQLRGIAPPPGKVSVAEIARRAGLSEATVAQVERIALAKLARQLTGHLPPHLSKKLSAQLQTTNPHQP
jgi:transcriptional regulator with XRE-family HTH domain